LLWPLAVRKKKPLLLHPHRWLLLPLKRPLLLLPPLRLPMLLQLPPQPLLQRPLLKKRSNKLNLLPETKKPPTGGFFVSTAV
jgi:hypothetical protein